MMKKQLIGWGDKGMMRKAHQEAIERLSSADLTIDDHPEAYKVLFMRYLKRLKRAKAREREAELLIKKTK
jgi:hypothetical protein